MASEDTKHLSLELKEFINLTHSLILNEKADNQPYENQHLNSYAEKIWNIHHFTSEILKNQKESESTNYNLTILKNITETQIYSNTNSKESTTLISAADDFKYQHNDHKMELIFNNFVKDPKASEVFLENLMVIYKELAA